jgi:hypothetical protein
VSDLTDGTGQPVPRRDGRDMYQKVTYIDYHQTRTRYSGYKRTD